MFDWEFRDPWFFLLLLLVPLVWGLANRSAQHLIYSSLQLTMGIPRGLRARLAWLPALLISLAIGLLVIALAGPRTPDSETKFNREGIAIAMVVDRSGSMHARDLIPEDTSIDRLTVVKRVFSDFVLGAGSAGRGREDDLVGLITFARFADSLCPLTTDHGNLVSMTEDLEIVADQSEDGTAIGEGLALAIERLRRNTAKSKIAILLTDGVNNAGDIEPKQAAKLAADHQVKVYCIGAGSDGIAPIPQIDPRTYQPARSRDGRVYLHQSHVEIDEELLRDIAHHTGGRYYRVTNAEGLSEVYREIDRLERTKVNEIRYLQYTEHYGSFVLTALSLIATATVLSGTFLRRLP